MSRRIVNDEVKHYKYKRVLKNGHVIKYVQLVYWHNNKKKVETYSLTSVKNEHKYINELIKQKENELKHHNFREYFNKFLEYKKNDIDVVTYNNYLNRSKNILDYLGDMYLEDINAEVLREYYIKLLTDGKRDEKKRKNGNTGLSYDTVCSCRMILKMFYKYMIDIQGLTELSNVCENVKVPHINSSINDEEEPFMTKEEVNRFLECVANDKTYSKYSLAFKMCIYYGLRRSELVGIKWESVDFDNMVFKVENTIVFSDGELIKKNKTKNKYSERSYPILSILYDDLASAYDKNKEKEYVFDYDPRALSKAFKICVNKYGFDSRLHLHSLRHTTVCIMAMAGKDWPFIKNWIGHSIKSITLERTYMHVVGDLRKKNADDISNIFK